MSGTDAKCPKCSGTMEAGALIDYGDKSRIADWLLEKPQFGRFGGLGLLGRPTKPVQGLRCRDCGFLELYAK